ncbi:MAG: D-glycero-beta-D-manno-heptose 1-phosphate adenylyltransferase [Acidobacteria bacterium]|nr:D-glycero-beta-D-manno-heptose 1-phosphate adenylyltransferase [Acidobacteriota bacterium]
MSGESQSIADLLRRVAGVRLLVVGDFMLDRTIYGEAGRISPEAPTPVVLVQQSREQLGGAGNVVRNIGSLGGRISTIAVAGEDAAADILEDRLHGTRGCESMVIIREPGRKTTVKTRVVAVQPGRANMGHIAQGHQQMLRMDDESRHPLLPETIERVFSFAAEKISSVLGLVISDYAKGALPPELLQRLIALARSAGKPIFIDPKERNFDRYRGASVLTPNAMEAESALGLTIVSSGRDGDEDGDAGWARAIQERLADWSIEALLVTRGAEGLSLVHRRGFHHFPTSAREVFDVTGAGDTVLAAFALAAASGASFAEAAQLGNSAAAVAVSKAGAAVVYPYEIERELAVRQSSAETKLRSREEMRVIAENLRREGRRMVFTNGCFDLLHPGHIYLLREAKKLGEVLIVGMNSDASVKRLKGESRPIVPEQDRAEAIGGLESVDHVVLFAEDDPLELLNAIRPDVLIKGDDYKESEVVGADLLKSYGGVVRLIPLRRGISTTRLVEKIRSGLAEEP